MNIEEHRKKSSDNKDHPSVPRLIGVKDRPIRMGDPDRTTTCTECGSENSELLEKAKPAPGGFYMYRYQCKDCGNKWRT